MSYNIYLDTGLFVPPKTDASIIKGDYWYVCPTVEDAITLIEFRGWSTYISFSPYLGVDETGKPKKNGYDLAIQLIHRCYEQENELIAANGWPIYSCSYSSRVEEKQTNYDLIIWNINSNSETKITLPFSYTVHSTDRAKAANIYNLLESYEGYRYKIAKMEK